MVDSRGFTLVEILVTMVLLSAIIGVAFYGYNKMASSVRTESGSIESRMDKIVGLELLRLDIENAGLGVGTDESNLPVEYNATSQALTLRATMNNTNQSTYGWVFVNCKSGQNWNTSSVLMVDEREVTSNDNLVFIDYRRRYAFSVNSTSTSCPRNAHYVGYPINPSSTGCSNQICTQITYQLSTTQSLSTCAPGTKNLLRKVDGGAGNPILNCVADIDWKFGLDTDGDGGVDTVADGSGIPTTSSGVRSQMKYIIFYALVQNSTYDSSYNFGSSNVTVDNGVALSLPTGCTTCSNYHWKVIKKLVKLMNL